MTPERDLVQQTLDALERLTRMFALERMLYLACSFLSFLLLLFCLWTLFEQKQLLLPQLGLAFGASGLIAASAARVSFFLNRSFDLIAKIIEALAGLRKEP
jgi:hypothetical protein